MSKMVDLSDVQKLEVLERMNKRLNGELGFDLPLISKDRKPLVNLVAKEEDFSVLESEGEVIGMVYSTIVTKNNESIDLLYAEVKELWLYQTNSLETNQEVVDEKLNEFEKSKDYDVALKYLSEQGISLVKDGRKVINLEKETFDQESGETTKAFMQGLVIDIKDQNDVVGYVVFNENTLIQFYKDEDAIIFVEGKPESVPLNGFMSSSGVTTYAAAGPKWRNCMRDCIGCRTWSTCLQDTCLISCVTCINPLACAPCAVCAALHSPCFWKCRMCVPGAARPNECPS